MFFSLCASVKNKSLWMLLETSCFESTNFIYLSVSRWFTVHSG